MNKKQKKVNLNDRVWEILFKINKKGAEASSFLGLRPSPDPQSGFVSGPHWGLPSPRPWKYSGGVRGCQSQNTQSAEV